MKGKFDRLIPSGLYWIEDYPKQVRKGEGYEKSHGITN
jgi:hypothetical protein